ncbi:MAG: glycosyltransferase family 39 protein [Gammaproteobacteria bacterium]|nr:glycosyltransferase family 39 protein [Gammaproteobacteria bacterium]
MPRSAKIFLILYLLILAVTLAGKPLNGDAYYYWNWSHHLALSYYDGPPLIAYIIKLFTTVFGHHDYSLYLFNLLTAAVTAIIVFRISKQLFNPTAATLAMMIWLLTLTAVHTYFMRLSYDTPLILFWALTFYAFVQLVERKQRRYYYLTALAAGLMLLSNYRGVLLLLALLLLCLFDKRQRFVFKTVHCYLALLLTLLIFSPVLIWNSQHHWASFQFQLRHGFNTFHTIAWFNIVNYLHQSLTGSNVAFLALLYILAVHYRQIIRDYRLRLLLVPTLFTWLFFLCSGFFSLPLSFWSSPFTFTNAMLLAPFCERGMRSNLLRGLFLAALALPTVSILIMSRIPALTVFRQNPGNIPVNHIYIPSEKAKQMLAQLPTKLYQQKPLFVANTYTLGAYLAAFLPGKQQQVFSTNPDTHQYFYWWQQAKAHINSPEALYFSLTAVDSFPTLFSNCQLVAHLQQPEKFILAPDCIWHIFVYNCTIEK